MGKLKDNSPYRFYVYIHRRKDNDEVFYVGKGNAYRATSTNKRSTYWTRVVNKYGFYVEYVEKGLSEQCALDLEVALIKFYRDNGHELCNHTDGGEGSSGYKHTEETKARMVEYHKNFSNVKDAQKAAVCRPVLCSNGMVFDSCKQAEIWLANKHSSSKVSTCCRRESKSACGYVWRFLTDCEDLQKMLDEGKDAFTEWSHKVIDYSLPKTVFCSNGFSFTSLTAAEEWCRNQGNLKVCARYLLAACEGKKKTLMGLKWSFEDIFVNSITEETPENIEIFSEFLVPLLKGYVIWPDIVRSCH